MDAKKIYLECCVCSETTKRLHKIKITTCLGHADREENLCCKCVNKLENWLSVGRLRK